MARSKAIVLEIKYRQLPGVCGRHRPFFPPLSWWLPLLGQGEGGLCMLWSCALCAQPGWAALLCPPPERAKGCCPLRGASTASNVTKHCPRDWTPLLVLKAQQEQTFALSDLKLGNMALMQMVFLPFPVISNIRDKCINEGISFFYFPCYKVTTTFLV